MATTKKTTTPTPAPKTTTPAPAYNPMSGNPFVNAVGSTAYTPVTPAPATPAQAAAGTTPATPAAKTFTQADIDAAVNAALAKQTADAATARQTTANDAFGAFQAKFQALGLGDLANALLSKVTAPDAPTTAAGWYSALQATPEYKARFGDTNAMRTANGLPQLTEGEILTSEKNISNTLRNMGMPAGFYDQPKDFQQFIALDKSAAEVGDIVQAYKDIAASQVDPAKTAALQQYYGIDLNGVAAMLMDPTKAQPILNAIAQKGTTAAAASSAGIPDIYGAAQVAGGLGAGTLDYAKQAQAFATAQQLNKQAGTLANIYGNAYGNYNTAQGMQEAFQGPEAVQAQATRQRLATAETSQFGGSAGASQQGQSLGIGTAQGVS